MDGMHAVHGVVTEASIFSGPHFFAAQSLLRSKPGPAVPVRALSGDSPASPC